MNTLRNLIMAIALSLSVPTGPVLAQTAPELVQSVQSYAAAWASRDADTIVALHSEDSVFQLFVDGAEAARGKAAIKTQFQKILADNLGYSSTVRSILFGNGAVTIEYDIKMDPSNPFTFGNYSYVPTGRAYAIPAIDVIIFKDGLVSAKHTYLDTALVRANSKSAKPVGKAK